MMQGFGVHTFRFVNAEGRPTFVKFHWKPKLGTHSLAWDETQKIAGKNPDFNRADLWNRIEAGQFPEYDFCVQLVPAEDEHRFGFDLVRNHHRDGYHQMDVHQARASYHKNSLSGGCPAVGGGGSFTHYQERVDGDKIRKWSGSFADHYSQATLFWNSMSG